MRHLLFILPIIFCVSAYAQKDLTYYLPAGITYNSNIPNPKSVVGHEVGEWHISHDKLVYYMQALAKSSDRITLEEIGKTFEGRPLLNLVITSPQNHADIEELREAHLQLTDPAKSGSLNLETMPAVFYMGFSIHGNEPSGSNASLLAAYYLAAAEGADIDKLLNETIIVLDPSYNPDGLNRFANYVNANKSSNIYDDPNNRELNEPWPGGRTNHYWFDMNRDWLMTQLPESQARIQQFHRWKPNLLTDHHEMGSNNTFFFQPGIPSRNNPKTPQNAYTLTQKLGEFHAAALDSIGSLYYTQESYDDYYYGKGSTFPDINGGVGILFEQASSRGHARETTHGTLSFPFTIKNQFNTALSSLNGLNKLRIEFLEHQRNYFIEENKKANSSTERAIVFASKDVSSAYSLAELIDRQKVQIFTSSADITINGTEYNADEAFIIPLNTERKTLVKAMFDKVTTFQDSLFYDVSSWTLPLAFNVDYTTLSTKTFNAKQLGQAFNTSLKPKGEVVGKQSNYAYALEWTDYYSPKIAYNLLKEGFKIKVANEEFTSNNRQFPRGTLLLPVGIQKLDQSYVKSRLDELVASTGAKIYSLPSGLNYETFSLGSPTFRMLTLPKVAMLVGEGVRSYDAGEVWHLFDQRYDMEMTLLPIDKVGSSDLSRYNTIIMVDGSYSTLSSKTDLQLKNWVKEGGLIVASKRALKYLNKIGLSKFEYVNSTNRDSLKSLPYQDINEINGAQQIGGAIFNVKIDRTNPLFYGYSKDYLPVFRNSEDFLVKSYKPFANPMVYTNNPLLSGYISSENLEKLKNTSASGIYNYGQGKIIGFTDNLNFRAFWYGTNKVFMNAIFFGRDLNRSSSR